ncbi:hypothetical protein RSAG8_13812, partial [Rhizoctonia solani AG-8 WAC10335]
MGSELCGLLFCASRHCLRCEPPINVIRISELYAHQASSECCDLGFSPPSLLH